MNLHSKELTGSMAMIAQQVDHLIKPDLKPLSLACQAEIDRTGEETTALLLAMQTERSQAIANFTQLMLLVRPELSRRAASHFEALRLRKESRDD
ncbi:MAG: hypothetical protein AB7E72_01615 [Lysobacterales bacterium]